MASDKILTISVAGYNVENYLNETLDSLVVPEILDDIEVIVVDDGAKDNSYSIAKTYEERYPNTFKAVHKENGGLSSARNSGIRKAKGKYLMFVDSDDLLNKIDFEKIFSKEVDIIQYKMVYYYENTDKYMHLKNIDEQCNQYGLKDYIKLVTKL